MKDKTMNLKISGALFAVLIAASACQPTPQNQAALGAVLGGAAGLALSELVDANPQWTAVAVLGGAAAGAVVAQNQTTQECAYADGRGGYYIAPC
ncbi:glucose-6-phosphate isomerase [Rhodobacterales bacterium HKCCSP123]|nr:glucose-6-phosphate isomerase [Rhodobacterales bacterium HKCCSP123]